MTGVPDPAGATDPAAESTEDQKATVRDVERFMAGQLSRETLTARVARRRRAADRE